MLKNNGSSYYKRDSAWLEKQKPMQFESVFLYKTGTKTFFSFGMAHKRATLALSIALKYHFSTSCHYLENNPENYPVGFFIYLLYISLPVRTSSVWCSNNTNSQFFGIVVLMKNDPFSS